MRLVDHKNSKSHKGFTLVEVLVAILVLSLGILGLAALESHTLQTNHSAYLRSQATILTYDLADKMRANMQAEYWTLSASSHANSCVSYTGAATACNANTMAEKELYDWEASIAEILPSGSGTVSQASGSDLVTISIEWDDDRDSSTANEVFSVEFQL